MDAGAGGCVSFRMKIVLVSDTHLGALDASAGPALQRERRQWLRNAFAASVDFCIESRAAAYLHAGDLFHTPEPDADELAFASRELLKLRRAGIPALFAAGDHDVTPDEMDAPGLRALYEAGLAIILPATLKGRTLGGLPDRCPVILEGEGARVAVYGVSWTSELADPTPATASAMKLRAWPGVNLLLIHAPVEGGPASWPAGVANADVVAAGHKHQHNMFRTATGLVLVPGSSERVTLPDEAEVAPGFWVVTARGREVSAVRVQTPAVPTVRLVLDASGIAGDDPTSAVLDQVTNSSQAGQLLYVVVQGEMSRELFRAVRWATIAEEGGARNLHFVLDTRRLWVVPEGTDPECGAVSPQREIQAAADEMCRLTEEETEMGIIREARDLLLSKYLPAL